MFIGENPESGLDGAQVYHPGSQGHIFPDFKAKLFESQSSQTLGQILVPPYKRPSKHTSYEPKNPAASA